ncbi:MAG: hypothetical protein KAU41_11655 [Deltaproteobacteria bacterium]|nr:hypothetical protein [Deltaproteobacteria bacterium]
MNANTVMCGFVFAEAATGDNVTAVICAAQSLRGKRIARHNGGTGRQRKAAKPIGRPNGEGG